MVFRKENIQTYALIGEKKIGKFVGKGQWLFKGNKGRILCNGCRQGMNIVLLQWSATSL